MLIQNCSLFSVKLNTNNTNSTSFKSKNYGHQDTFEVSDVEKKKKFEEQKVKNPNSAFLYDPDLTYEQKVAELKKHPEIKKVNDVIHGYKFDSSSIKDDIFDFDILEKPIFGRRTRKINMRYIDTTTPKNKRTIEVLTQNKKNLYDFSSYTFQVDMPNEVFKRYLKIGRMERFEVYPENAKKTGRHSQLIDITNEKNKNAVENYKKLNLRSKFLNTLLNSRRTDKVYANILELDELV